MVTVPPSLLHMSPVQPVEYELWPSAHGSAASSRHVRRSALRSFFGSLPLNASRASFSGEDAEASGAEHTRRQRDKRGPGGGAICESLPPACLSAAP